GAAAATRHRQPAASERRRARATGRRLGRACGPRGAERARRRAVDLGSGGRPLAGCTQPGENSVDNRTIPADGAVRSRDGRDVVHLWYSVPTGSTTRRPQRRYVVDLDGQVPSTGCTAPKTATRSGISQGNNQSKRPGQVGRA